MHFERFRDQQNYEKLSRFSDCMMLNELERFCMEGSNAHQPGPCPSSSSGSGGGSGSSKPSHEEHAAAIRDVGDSALQSLMKMKRESAGKSMKKQRAEIVPEAEKHIAKVNEFFDGLKDKVKSDKEANDIAKAMGYQAVTGSKDKVLDTLKKKTLDRIGSFIRPFA